MKKGAMGEIVSLSSASKRLPTHLAVIMDGNGRWAKERGLARLEGHKAGGLSVKNIVKAASDRGIQYLTLFSFSTENWNRSDIEVKGIMRLFKEYLDNELPVILEQGIRLLAVGNIEGLPNEVQESLKRDIELSKNNTKLTLVLALNYGGREEIVNAAKNLALLVEKGEITSSEITEEVFASKLWSDGIPDPDLLIRTSGEMRVSNFLLWQIAYTELVVVPEYWPEFNNDSLDRALIEFAKRERRFGCTSEQIEKGEHKELATALGYSVADYGGVRK